MAAFIGIAVGLALVAGPWMLFNKPISMISDAAVAGGFQAFDAVATQIPFTARVPKLSSVVVTLLACCIPGLVAAALVWATRAGISARRALAAVLVIGALFSFTAVDFTDGATLLIAAAGVTTLLVLFGGLIADVGLWATATFIAATHGAALFRGDTDVARRAVTTVIDVSGVNVPELWAPMVALVALTPFAVALFTGLDFPERGQRDD